MLCGTCVSYKTKPFMILPPGFLPNALVNRRKKRVTRLHCMMYMRNIERVGDRHHVFKDFLSAESDNFFIGVSGNGVLNRSIYLHAGGKMFFWFASNNHIGAAGKGTALFRD